MYHATNFRTFSTRRAILGLTIADVIKVHISAIHIKQIIEMVNWCMAHPVDRPFFYSAQQGHHLGTDRNSTYEVTLYLLDADAAFEAKLRFG